MSPANRNSANRDARCSANRDASGSARHPAAERDVPALWDTVYVTATRSDHAVELAHGALDWLLASALDTENGLVWQETPTGDEPNPTLYSGAAGIVLALLEARRHFNEDRYGDAALRAARAIAAAIDQQDNCSLYFGLAGTAVALRAVGESLADMPAVTAADRALDQVRSRFDGERWSDQFDLLGGNAGIALAALDAGDAELAARALTPYLHTAEPTPDGVQWESRTDLPARFHHISHGTLGVVYALAAVGHATGRADLAELALAGAADVIARNEAGPAGFLVPHSDPQHRPESTPRHSYGWCHGPTGDAQVFRLLGALTQDPTWPSLVDRCWHTITHSGLPQRLRPGFWDNNGRCCGTAGVLALACDQYAERRADLAFGNDLVTDLAARATVDADGVRWSNHEHRATPSALAPRTGWAMGNAGIIRELLRFARVSDGGDPTYAVAWPDHPQVLRSGLVG
jgi:lantibiotic modifying enzyme